MERDYDPRLAQLRFFAAFSVVLYHLWTLQILPLPLLRPGWLGVPIFLALSIYLLLKRLDANSSLRRYFKRRVERIYPLYYLSVTAVFLMRRCYFHAPVTYMQLILHYLFISYILAPFSFNYVFWTLQLEEWMYFAIPLIHKLSDDEKLVVAQVLIAVSLAYTSTIAFLPRDTWHTLFFMPPTWLGAYGWGIYAYVAEKRGRIPAGNAHYYALLALYLAYVATAVAKPGDFLYRAITHAALYNLFLAITPLILLKPPRVWGRAIVFLGEVSYGIYLWHLLFEEIFGAAGVALGILAAIATEFPLRRREIVARLKATHR